MIETVAAFMRDGGIFMYIILVVSVVGAAIVVERGYVLLLKFNVDSRLLWENVSRHILEGDMEKAAALCKGSGVPLLRLLNAGISASGSSRSDIQDAVDEVAVEIIPSIDRRLNHLATLANVATLLGLLGTIQGLIQSFSAVGIADPSQKAAILASGISIALYTTFFGLIVAIPMLIAYTFFHAKAMRIIDEMDEFSIKLMNLTKRMKDAAQAK
ncbi:MAG: MotA/TolQ/ExbB proton channel family protein [Deltaproteobacteria bacterium]